MHPESSVGPVMVLHDPAQARPDRGGFVFCADAQQCGGLSSVLGVLLGQAAGCLLLWFWQARIAV